MTLLSLWLFSCSQAPCKGELPSLEQGPDGAVLEGYLDQIS